MLYQKGRRVVPNSGADIHPNWTLCIHSRHQLSSWVGLYERASKFAGRFHGETKISVHGWVLLKEANHVRAFCKLPIAVDGVCRARVVQVLKICWQMQECIYLKVEEHYEQARQVCFRE